MVKYEFKNPRFIKTAVKPKDYPILRNIQGKLLPEIAVAGRSNVGKSSLLNDLFQRKGLVKTSSTPGKTQALNFFVLNEQLSFVDLPGYGYAEVPMEVRRKWGPMIEAYLDSRETLKSLLFLFDIRRLPNDEDRLLIEWAIARHKSLLLVLTKVDKVKQNEKVSQTQKILNLLPFKNLPCVHYSVTKNVGRRELMFWLRAALKEEDVDPSFNPLAEE
jgi:GTP-binding protein